MTKKDLFKYDFIRLNYLHGNLMILLDEINSLEEESEEQNKLIDEFLSKLAIYDKVYKKAYPRLKDIDRLVVDNWYDPHGLFTNDFIVYSFYDDDEEDF